MSVTQAQFKAAILDANLPAPAGLCDAEGRAAVKRFDVYRNNVAVGLSDALEAAFPTIQKLVGDKFFRAMAGVYLRQHSPSSPIMMFYGAQMPGFLASFPPVAHLPYLADIARLELALRRSYHAQDAAPIAPDALATMAPDQLERTVFHFAPAVLTIASPYPISSIWAANQKSAPPPQHANPETALITRIEYDPDVTSLAPGPAKLLTLLMEGMPLGKAAVRAGDSAALNTLLPILFSQNAIVALTD